MRGKEPTLTEAIRALSSHPSLEELAAFHERRLAPEKVEGIRRHLASCADCSEESMEVARFLAPEEGKPPLDRAAVQTVWHNLAESLELQGEDPGGKEREAAPSPLPPAATAFGLRQPVAAGLLVACVVSAGAWLASRQEVARLQDGEVNVPVVAIDQAARRRIEEGEQRPQPIEVPPGAVLVLTPFLDPADAAHEVSISDAGGATVWSGDGLRPANGNFQFRLPRDLRPGKTYRIRITPGEDQGFTIRLRAPGPD